MMRAAGNIERLSLLNTCDQEPVHTPDAIQPQGVLLVAGSGDLVVTHTSANTVDWLGLPARAVLGRSLHEVLGEQGGRTIQNALTDKRFGFCNVLPVSPPAAPRPLQMVVHPMADSVCIELEIAVPDAERGRAIQHALTIMQALHAASSQGELCNIVVAKLRQLIGYDRVMAYKFDREGHGEVIAEACEPDLEPYLGQRYPASDIPRQARRMYLTQRVRAIADVDYVPVPLLADATVEHLAPLDMTLCALRSVSPVHLEYMRNMGTQASLGLSLIINNSLWGMLICHHRSPLAITADLRAQCDLIGQLVSLLLGSLGEAEAYAEQLRRQRTFQEVAAPLGNAGPVMDALALSGDALLKMMDAKGAVVTLGGRNLTLGVTPPAEATERALTALHAVSGDGLVALDELQEILPEWSAHCAIASGALFLPLLPNSTDAIIWFRPEMERVVTWGGDPRKPTMADTTTGRLSPRHSFAAWRELVRGHSEPWQEADRATARELQRTVTTAIARQAEAELAKLRYYDALTGLPNRRMFQERIKAQGVGPDTALLYLDLDRFKAVNDMLGHSAGDALLCAVAQRMSGCSREGDLVVRLGGDEFAIVQSGGEQPFQATALAQRIIAVLNQPFDIVGQQVEIGVSVGIALGEAGTELDTLLDYADQALYQAKAAGRGTYRLFHPNQQEAVPSCHAVEAISTQMTKPEPRSGIFPQGEAQVVAKAGALAGKTQAAAMSQSLGALEHLLNAVPHPILVKDRMHRWLATNDAMWTLMGRRREDMLTFTDYQLPPKEPANGYWASDDEVLATGVEQEVEEDLIAADGQTCRVKSLKRRVTIPGPSGDEVFLVVSITDLTREGKIGPAQHELEEDRRYALEFSPLISWTADPAGRVIEIAQRWYQITGMTSEEVQDRGWLGALHPEDLSATQYQVAVSRETGRALDVECRFHLSDRSSCWFRLRASARYDSEGRVIRWYGTMIEINKRKLAEIALRDSETRFRTMADDAPVVVWVTDPTGECTFMNRFWQQMTGQTEADACGFGRLEAVHPDDRDEAKRAFTAAAAEQTVYRTEYRLLRADGETSWVIDTAAPRIALDGTFLGYIGSVIDISERRKAETALRKSEAFARSILDNSPDCIRVHDRQGRLLFTNAAGRHLMDVDNFSQIEGRTWETFWPVEDLPQIRAAARAALAGKIGHFTAAHPAPDGTTKWWEGKLCPVDFGEGEARRFLSILRDVTETKFAREEAEALAARLSAVLESTTDCVVVLDRNWRVTYINQRTIQMLAGRLAVGVNLWQAFPHEIGGVFDQHYRQAVDTQVPVAFEAYLVAQDSWLEVHAFPSANGLSIFFQDVSESRRLAEERQRSQEQLVHMARHDALTGLANRFLFYEQLERGIAEAAPEASIAVLCLDLDGFKTINDTLGHPAGDALLRQVAKRLHGCVRNGDTGARTGGDEFAVLQTGIEHIEDVVQFAQRLVGSLNEPFELGDQLVAVGASVGVAMLEAGLSAEDLIKRADVALYHAKAKGRGSIYTFEPGMDAALRQRQTIRLELANAVTQGNFELHYQPQVDLRSGEVTGFEALLRWRHPTRGLIPTGDFIPVAEETGLVRAIGEWALHEACREAARWPGEISVAVNLSAVQFWSGDLAHTVAAALAEAGLPAARLELEITESVLLQENEAILATLHALRKLGIRIAMDDFGTGYSSLSYLRSFPFDKIKIDRSFVTDLPDGREAFAIMRAVVSLAESLGMATTAEGVETWSQLECLRRKGVNQVQGFLLSRAVPAAEVPRLIQRLSGIVKAS